MAEAAAGVALTLYSRTCCHLCEDMAAALEPLRREFGFRVERVEVDRDPALDARYGERVPVLAHGDSELCHYLLDASRVRAYLARIG